jgi:hypothetical protein
MKNPKDGPSQYDEHSVCGLPLPKLLLELINSGHWKHPGDDVILAALPFLKDPVVFLNSPRTAYLMAANETSSAIFHEYRGSKEDEKPLPWLDVEASHLIAINKNIGDDVAIALDYRSNPDDPRVLASDWHSGPGCFWREVSPSFTEFVKLLGIES